MIGSIIGDIVGSIYEFNNIKTKDFEFFQDSMSYTDDSILTFATADWILNGGNPEDYYLKYALKYDNPKGGYGNGFRQWIQKASKGELIPYNSCGNGSAMRVGPVGWAVNTMRNTLRVAKMSARVTHNHPEGIKGAQATALCIYMARKGLTKDDIRFEMNEMFDYDMDFTCDSIRDTYSWGATCQDTVPQAIECVLEAEDFEDAIRNAISLGGDSDTLACISGSIAEALFGVPEEMRAKAETYLPKELLKLMHEFEKLYK